jgi:hypothetical protein
MRGAISTKKKIPRIVKIARNVPAIVSSLTTTRSLFRALTSAAKKTDHKRIMAIKRVMEKRDVATPAEISYLHSKPPIQRKEPMIPNQLIHQTDSKMSLTVFTRFPL